MSRMIFDLTDDDREALERLRAARGLRSQAEVLRALIRENTADGEITLGVVKTPKSGEVVELEPVANHEPRVVTGVIEKAKPAPAVHVEVPVYAPKAFNPRPKTGKPKGK